MSRRLLPLLLLLMLTALSASAQGFYDRAKNTTTFQLTNSSSWDIYYVYISSTDDSSWGDDLLGDMDIVESGETVTLRLSDGCGSYDMKLVDEDDDVCTIMGVELCDDAWVVNDADWLDCLGIEQGASGNSTTFTLTNSTLWNIEYVYISSSDDSSWGDDLLGSQILDTDETLTLRLGDGCGTYDMKLVDEDGDVCTIFGVELCEDGWTIQNSEWLDCLE